MVAIVTGSAAPSWRLKFRVPLAVAGLSLLLLGSVAAPREQGWADLDARQQQRIGPHGRRGAEKAQVGLEMLRAGAFVCGGNVVSQERIAADTWRLVVRFPNGDVVVRIARNNEPSDERAAQYGLTGEPSAAPRELTRSVLHALADEIGRAHV